jgi:hypothetical protein
MTYRLHVEHRGTLDTVVDGWGNILGLCDVSVSIMNEEPTSVLTLAGYI